MIDEIQQTSLSDGLNSEMEEECKDASIDQDTEKEESESEDPTEKNAMTQKTEVETEKKTEVKSTKGNKNSLSDDKISEKVRTSMQTEVERLTEEWSDFQVFKPMRKMSRSKTKKGDRKCVIKMKDGHQRVQDWVLKKKTENPHWRWPNQNMRLAMDRQTHAEEEKENPKEGADAEEERLLNQSSDEAQEECDRVNATFSLEHLWNE